MTFFINKNQKHSSNSSFHGIWLILYLFFVSFYEVTIKAFQWFLKLANSVLLINLLLFLHLSSFWSCFSVNSLNWHLFLLNMDFFFKNCSMELFPFGAIFVSLKNRQIFQNWASFLPNIVVVQYIFLMNFIPKGILSKSETYQPFHENC